MQADDGAAGARVQSLTFPETIDQARLASGMSKSAIARETGVARAQVIRWMKGDTLPQPHNVRRLASLFGVDEAWLMRLAGYLTADQAASDAEDTPALATLIAVLRRRWDELQEPEQRAIAATVHAIAGAADQRFSPWYLAGNPLELLQALAAGVHFRQLPAAAGG